MNDDWTQKPDVSALRSYAKAAKAHSGITKGPISLLVTPGFGCDCVILAMRVRLRRKSDSETTGVIDPSVDIEGVPVVEEGGSMEHIKGVAKDDHPAEPGAPVLFLDKTPQIMYPAALLMSTPPSPSSRSQSWGARVEKYSLSVMVLGIRESSIDACARASGGRGGPWDGSVEPSTLGAGDLANEDATKLIV